MLILIQVLNSILPHCEQGQCVCHETLSWLISFSLDVNANSPTEFYLLELLKVLVPVIGIAFILIASIRRYRAVPSRAAAWLSAIGALWLLVALASRLALSGPVRSYFMSAAMARLDPEHLHEPMYFAITSWLWTADEVMLLLFGVALFVAWRADRTHLANR